MHKIAFELGPVTATWYGILVAFGFLAGIWTASRRGLRSGFQAETIFDLGPWLLIGAIVGARGLYVISYWQEDFAGKPIWEIFKIYHGGIVFYGGLIGASLACVIYTQYRKLPLWRVADVLAPSIALGSVWGRFGCLMNGCCYGRPTDLPWAIHFPTDHPTLGGPVHPTEIYDSLLNLVLYLILAWLFRRKKFDGQVFGCFLIGYAAFRSFVEQFRGDYGPAHYLAGLLTPAQVVSIGIALAGVLLLLWRSRPAPTETSS